MKRILFSLLITLVTFLLFLCFSSLYSNIRKFRIGALILQVFPDGFSDWPFATCSFCVSPAPEI